MISAAFGARGPALRPAPHGGLGGRSSLRASVAQRRACGGVFLGGAMPPPRKPTLQDVMNVSSLDAGRAVSGLRNSPARAPCTTCHLGPAAAAP